MAAWRREWRRNGAAMMASAFALYIAFESGGRQVLVASTGRILVVGPPNGWLVFVFLAIFLFGIWAWVASQTDAIPLFGRKKAMDPECAVSTQMGFVWNKKLLFVVVENLGETASFAAHFSNVQGLVHDDDGGALEPDYFGKVAWEDTTDDRQTLGSGGKARLVTLAFDATALGCRFRLPHSSTYRPGDVGDDAPRYTQGFGMRRAAPDVEVSFDLTVINETKIASRKWRVLLLWPNPGQWGSPQIVSAE